MGEGTLFGTQNLSELNLSIEIEDEFWSGHEEVHDPNESNLSGQSSALDLSIGSNAKRSMSPETNQLIKLRLVEDAYRFPDVAKNKHLEVDGFSTSSNDTPKFKNAECL